MKIELVDIEDIEIVYLQSENFPDDIGKLWYNFECRFPDIKKRKFYGIFFVIGDQPVYRVCSEIKELDEAVKLNLKRGIIPGGIYAKTRVSDWSNDSNNFESIFNKISEKYPFDDSRPSIEYFRSKEETILMLPVNVD